LRSSSGGRDRDGLSAAAVNAALRSLAEIAKRAGSRRRLIASSCWRWGERAAQEWKGKPSGEVRGWEGMPDAGDRMPEVRQFPNAPLYTEAIRRGPMGTPPSLRSEALQRA